ncbi:MAG: ExbD/TolR family protein [Lysobacteraceae bacterium]
MPFATNPSQRSVAEMNITPLVDVMLVLLVIFMVAAPVLTRRIPLDLPQAAPPATATPPAPGDLRIDAAGGVTWNGVPASLARLPSLLDGIAQADAARAPLLRIDANADADYGDVARVLALARNAGVRRIAFVRR